MVWLTHQSTKEIGGATIGLGYQQALDRNAHLTSSSIKVHRPLRVPPDLSVCRRYPWVEEILLSSFWRCRSSSLKVQRPIGLAGYQDPSAHSPKGNHQWGDSPLTSSTNRRPCHAIHPNILKEGVSTTSKRNYGGSPSNPRRASA
jgi:hypothetical protein